jgi:hypothetical protein
MAMQNKIVGLQNTEKNIFVFIFHMDKKSLKVEWARILKALWFKTV